MNGPAIDITARNLGSATCQRGTGERVRFASVRSSTSLPNDAAAIARTTSGAIDPASIVLRIAVSKSVTDGALAQLSIIVAMRTGMEARMVMIARRHRPDSCLSVRL